MRCPREFLYFSGMRHLMVASERVMARGPKAPELSRVREHMPYECERVSCCE